MNRVERRAGTKSVNENAAAVHFVVEMIRQSSEAGQLILESEIVHRLIDQHLITSEAADLDPKKKAESILGEAMDGSEDLHQLGNRDGSRHYYSSLFMSESYARILHQKQSNRLELIAEIVRQNSAVYPRPVPLDIFTQPPFEFTHQEVLNDLERMAAEEEYKDIVRTTTSGFRVFLYSTLHLEPEYASMLAEWLDVGQFDNP